MKFDSKNINKTLLLICYMGVLFLTIPVFCPAGDIGSDTNNNELSLINAVRYTIDHQDEIHLSEQQVEVAKGTLRSAKGQFDWQLNTALNQTVQKTPYTAANQKSTGFSHSEYGETSLKLSINKQLRSGIIMGPSIETIRSEDRTFDSDSENRTKISYSISVPLLKGAGRNVVGAREMAADTDLETYQLNLCHTISENIYKTTIAYWHYLMVSKKLEILKESEDVALKNFLDFQKLIDADQHPASDIDQLQANLAAKKSTRLSAEQELFEARQSLGLFMGLSFDEILSLTRPGAPFPEIIDVSVVEGIDVKNMIEISSLHRNDLKASKKEEKSTKILLTEAINGTKPDLNLMLEAGYNGLDEGDSLSNTWSSMSDTEGTFFILGIQAQYPFGNNSASGILAQRKASHRQAVLHTTILEKNIKSNLITAIHGLRKSIVILQNELVSVAAYRKAVKSEQLKLRTGMSTIMDLIAIENYLRAELIKEIQYMKNYANALIRLRYETGTILFDNNGTKEVSYESLTRLPGLSPG